MLRCALSSVGPLAKKHLFMRSEWLHVQGAENEASHGAGHLCREQDEPLRELQAQLNAVQRDGAAGHAWEPHQQDSFVQLKVESQITVALLPCYARSLEKGAMRFCIASVFHMHLASMARK